MDRAGDPAFRYLGVAGQRLRYVVAGPAGAARTLLLFNGIGANIETALPFAAGFAHTRVIAFDVPGVGDSPAPWLPYRLRRVARLAVGLLDHLGVTRADVFGVSWGGAAAQEFAIRYPQRCRTLTLAATCAGFVMVPGQPRVCCSCQPAALSDPATCCASAASSYGGIPRLSAIRRRCTPRCAAQPPAYSTSCWRSGAISWHWPYRRRRRWS